MAVPPDGPHNAALLTLIGEIMGVLELEEFQQALVTGLRHAVPSDWVSLNSFGPGEGDQWVIADPPNPPQYDESWPRLAHQNPLIQRIEATGDGRAYRFSDQVTREEFHALDLYREIYSELGVEYQIAFTLPSERGHLIGVALSRSERDYTDAERDLLNLGRPFLIQAYRNMLAFEALQAAPAPTGALAEAGLTAREAEVLELVAAGQRDQDAASALGLSVRTVQKHLQNSYRKLGVDSRTQAIARARS
jgi:DNA-binding CsgD family transcriptional regulator